jgi:hydrogenase nickel incorporation protein HypA/HybF
MHELALADAVVKAALQAAGEAGMDHIDRIVIRVGELQQIERELFEYSLTEVLPAREPRLAGVHFDVGEERVRFGCRSCGHQYGRDDVDLGDDVHREAVHFIPELSHAYARCPQCGSPDFDILAGRGITVAQIEGTSDDDAS